MEKYSSIIDKPYNKSTKKARMSLNDRASQFAPFAALNGYEDSINEVNRITFEKIEISDEEKELISNKLNFISKNKIKSEIEITYFIKDERKSGGLYQTNKVLIKKIDDINKTIILNNGTIIYIEDIINVSSVELDKVFNLYE